jgi:hypothetical protein
VVLALLTSGAYILIAGQLGMPIPHSLPLWLFGVFAIGAVGITSTSLIGVLGAFGLLVIMFVFVILGLPSAGATLPLQAAPPLFGWLANSSRCTRCSWAPGRCCTSTAKPMPDCRKRSR